MANSLTDRQAAKAARQLAYHHERLAEIEARMAENSQALDQYLLIREEEAAQLPGGYRVQRDEDGKIQSRKPERTAHGYQQLCLI